MKFVRFLALIVLCALAIAVVVYALRSAKSRLHQKDRPATVYESNDREAVDREAPFEADVYPSQRAAARQLADRFAAEVIDATKDTPLVIQLAGPANVDHWTYDALKDRLRSKFPKANFRLEKSVAATFQHPSLKALWTSLVIKTRERVRVAGQGSTPIDQPLIALIPSVGNIPTPALLNAIKASLPQTDVTVEDVLGSSSDLGPSKELIGLLSVSPNRSEPTLTLESIAPAVSVSISYVDKPWADDFAAYANQHAKQGKWVMAQSSPDKATLAEAAAEARHFAVQSIREILRKSIAPSRFRSQETDDEFIQSKLDRDLEKGRFVDDTFSQRFERPYGNVFRESMLVDISHKSIEQLAGEINHELREQGESIQRTILFACGLMVLVYLIYIFVNSMTRGYFVWRLRTTALLLAAVGVLFLIYVM